MQELRGNQDLWPRILGLSSRDIGGDYGFGWNPHGDYARELTFFVREVGFTPLETLTCATKTGAEIMGLADEIGTLESGKLADLLIVGGDVLKAGNLAERQEVDASRVRV